MQLHTLQDPASVKTRECRNKLKESQCAGKHHRCLGEEKNIWKTTTTTTTNKKRLELKGNVVFKVVDYLEEFTAWKSETLKQFYVVSQFYDRHRG